MSTVSKWAFTASLHWHDFVFSASGSLMKSAPRRGSRIPSRSERVEHLARVRAPDAEHGRELVLRQRHVVFARALHRREDPFRGALLDGMDRVAGIRLENLRQQTIGVARKQRAQTWRFVLRRGEIGQLHAHEGSAELHDNLGIGGKVTLADNAADRAFASDQKRFDIAAIFVDHKKRHEARAAWKIDHVDILSGAVEVLIGAAFPRLEPSCDLGVIFRSYRPDEIVLTPGFDRGQPPFN